MNESTMDWEDLKLFLAVARAGGLSAAVKSTGKSAPTLARRILRLEQSTGLELFVRLSHGYALTASGEVLLQKVQAIEAKIARIDRSSNQNKKVLVKISAGSWMTQALMKHADQLMHNNASAQLRFIAAEQALDIGHRETLIGLRNQRPEQLELACRKTGTVHFAVYAVDESVVCWARVMTATPTARWLAQHTELAQVIEVSSPRSALDLALAGVSKAILPCFVADAEPSLQMVGKIIPELSHDQWLVCHQEERHRPEVRRTLDQLFELCRGLLENSSMPH